MNSELNNKDAEKKAKNKTRIFLIVGLFIWMFGLFFFLNQSRFEHSLIFAKVLPTGWNPIPPNLNIIINNPSDTTDINPNVDPNFVIIDTDDIDSIDVNNNLPKSFSLKKYAPKVMSQGQLGSCVAWSTTYAGFTIVKRIEQENVANPVYAPLNLYVRMRSLLGVSPCGDGAYISYALNLLRRKGCAFFNSSPVECNKVRVNNDSKYRDKLFQFDQIEPSNINKIKKAISNKMPIIFGINCYDGDGWQNGVFNDGVWSGYYSGSLIGGHAMCLIGYDDQKGGGSFQIMNSWGENWGDHGFFWIKYADFTKHVDECYALFPKKK